LLENLQLQGRGRRQKYQTLDGEVSDDEPESEPAAAAAAAAAAAPSAAAAAAAAAAPLCVWPSQRMNTMLAVAGSTVYLLGGTLETKDRQVILCYLGHLGILVIVGVQLGYRSPFRADFTQLTLSDMYCLDLAKNDKCARFLRSLLISRPDGYFSKTTTLKLSNGLGRSRNQAHQRTVAVTMTSLRELN
jgi:hypothetical protein